VAGKGQSNNRDNRTVVLVRRNVSDKKDEHVVTGAERKVTDEKQRVEGV